MKIEPSACNSLLYIACSTLFQSRGICTWPLAGLVVDVLVGHLLKSRPIALVGLPAEGLGQDDPYPKLVGEDALLFSVLHKEENRTLRG